MPSRLARLGCALVSVGPLLASCDTDAVDAAPDDPGESWPADTVLVVDDVPLSAADVKPWADAIGELYPEYTLLNRRRLALTNIVLPRAAIRDTFVAEREAARQECRAAYERIDELADSAHQLEENWRRLGLELWAFARSQPLGTWSEPTELLGRWVVLRLEEVVPGRVPGEEKLNLRWLQFPYVDPDRSGMEMSAAIDESRLLVLDPIWGEAIPEDWKRRMKEGP